MKDSTIRRVMFLGFAVPDELFVKVLESDRGLPVQTQRFGWAVIGALTNAGVQVHPISVEPVADYPHNSRMSVTGRRFSQDGVEGRTVSFVNLTVLKHLSRYIAVRRAADRLAARCPPDAVIIHGVHSPMLWVGVRLGARLGIPVLTILTDAPSLRTRYDNRVTMALKGVDRSLILRALACMDGVITLAPALASDFAPGRPALWVEGIARRLEPRSSLEADRERTVVYAGGLHAAYGVLDLIDAVRKSNGSWRLLLYGRGPAEEQVREAAASSSRVEFAGTASTSELADVYARADLLVNPRPPDSDLTRHSFPSKVLEYLASGTPVLTTRLPNLPSDYEPHLFLTEPGGSELARAIDDLMATERDRLSAVGAAAQDFILSTRGLDPQGRRIVDFIASVQAKTQAGAPEGGKRA